VSELLPNKDGCPVCFHPLDAATCATGDARPEPGDLTVCLYCTTFLRFDDQLRHVKLQDGEFSQLDAVERRTLVRARNLIRSRNKTDDIEQKP
jgi:hypothetical protein